jgi:hypothetical protein
MILYAVAGAGLVAAAIVLVIVLGGKGASGKAGDPAAVRSAMSAAGCTLTTTKAAPSAQHSTNLKQSVTYPTYPPVSGRHYYLQAIWGDYRQVVDPRTAVHSQEHGGIVIWVGPDVSATERKEISDFYDESPNGMLVTPIENTADGVKYPKHSAPGSKVFLTAWTVNIENGKVGTGLDVIASCPRFDQSAFAAFRDEFRGKGPERFKVGDLKPGT